MPDAEFFRQPVEGVEGGESAESVESTEPGEAEDTEDMDWAGAWTEEAEPVADAPLPDSAPEPQPPELEPEPELEPIGNGARSGWRKTIFPRFRLGGFYDDNIFIQPEGKQPDFIGFFGFGLRAGVGEVQAPLYTLREARNVPRLYEAPSQPFGNFLFADYSGTYFAFADHSAQNAYDQDALLSAGWAGAKLSLGFQGRFQSLSDPDIDAGGRIRRHIIHTALSANYEVSGKTSVESTLSWTRTEYRGLNDANELQGEAWLNLQWTPKIKIAPGLGGGVLKAQGGPDQPYARALVRAVYDFSEKLALNGKIGVEYRDVALGFPFRNSPVVGVGVNWAPFEGTTLSLDGYRLAEASAVLPGTNYTRTGVDLKIRQRFLQRFLITLTGGYENLDYRAIAEEFSTSRRRDHYVFGRAAIAFDVTRWGTAELFYNFQRDSSTRPGNSFTDNQVGIELDFEL